MPGLLFIRKCVAQHIGIVIRTPKKCDARWKSVTCKSAWDNNRRNKHEKGIDVNSAGLIAKGWIESLFNQCRLVFDRLMDNGVEAMLGHYFVKTDHEQIARLQILVVALVPMYGFPPFLRAARHSSE